MKLKILMMMLAALLMLSACEKKATDKPVTEQMPDNPKPVSMMLQYTIEEPGLDPYPSRVIITNDFMRIDDGPGSDSYVLFDRKKQVVYSVSSDNGAILVVNKRDLPTKPPLEIHDSVRVMEEKNMPELEGKKAKHYYFDTDGVNCYEAFIVQDFLPEAARAYTDYRRVLAGDHAFTMSRVPKEELHPCDLSMNIFSSGRLFKQGLPIYERGPNGYVKSLTNYELDFKTNDAMFTLPKDYGRFTIEDMQKGLAAPEENPLSNVVPEEMQQPQPQQ